MATPLTKAFVVLLLYEFDVHTLNTGICCATVLYLFIYMFFLLFHLDTTQKGLNICYYIACE